MRSPGVVRRFSMCTMQGRSAGRCDGRGTVLKGVDPAPRRLVTTSKRGLLYGSRPGECVDSGASIDRPGSAQSADGWAWWPIPRVAAVLGQSC